MSDPDPQQPEPMAPRPIDPTDPEPVPPTPIIPDPTVPDPKPEPTGRRGLTVVGRQADRFGGISRPSWVPTLVSQG